MGREHATPRRIIVIIAFVLLVAASAQVKHEAAANGAWEADPDLGFIHRYGYVNCGYGYYVSFPKNVIGMGDLPPSPNHGFIINLASIERPPDTKTIFDASYYISVTNEYEAQHATKLSEIVDRELDYRREHYPHFSVLSNKAMRLGGLNAKRLLIRYKSGDKEMIEDLTLALRERSIDYSITMVTPADKYETNRSLLEDILSGFRVVRIINGKGECSNEWPPKYKAIQFANPHH